MADTYHLEISADQKNRIKLIDENGHTVNLSNYVYGKYVFSSNSRLSSFTAQRKGGSGYCFKATLKNMSNNTFREFVEDCSFWDKGTIAMVEACNNGWDLACTTHGSLRSDIGGCSGCSEADILAMLQGEYKGQYQQHLQNKSLTIESYVPSKRFKMYHFNIQQPMPMIPLEIQHMNRHQMR